MPHAEWPGDPDRLISTYFAAWNAHAALPRRQFLQACWSLDAVFTDPLVRVEGLDAMDGYIASVRAGDDQLRFALAGSPDHHHQRVRFGWRLFDAADRPLLEGNSFGEIGAAGRFERLVAFFDCGGEAPAPRSDTAAGAAFNALRRPAR